MKNTTTQVRVMYCVQFAPRKGQRGPCFAHWSLATTKNYAIAQYLNGTELPWSYFKEKGCRVRKVKHTIQIIEP
jgi:hypothetical protein